VKEFEKGFNNETIGIVERQLAKKKPNVPTSVIFIYFVVKEPFEKDDVQQKYFLQNLWPFDCEK